MVQKKKSDEQDVLVVRDEKTEASARQGGEHARLPAL